jgi:hypothetical protein
MISMKVLLERSPLNRSEPISTERAREDAHAEQREGTRSASSRIDEKELSDMERGSEREREREREREKKRSLSERALERFVEDVGHLLRGEKGGRGGGEGSVDASVGTKREGKRKTRGRGLTLYSKF